MAGLSGRLADIEAGLSTPMGRVGRSEEVAAVRWLCSGQASYITGIALPIDGGQFAGVKPPRVYRPGQPLERVED